MTKPRVAHVLSFCLSLLVILSASTILYAHRAHKYQAKIEYSNQQAYSELIESMSGINSALTKLGHASGGTISATLCAQIWRQSEAAKSPLSSLPMGAVQLEKTQKFIA